MLVDLSADGAAWVEDVIHATDEYRARFYFKLPPQSCLEIFSDDFESGGLAPWTESLPEADQGAAAPASQETTLRKPRSPETRWYGSQ